jgi:lysophospholipase L1-like esterase
MVASRMIRPRDALSRPIKIIPAGDSITASSNAFSSGVWQFASGFAEFAIRSAGARFNQPRNAGVSGDTSNDLRSRFQVDVIAYAPDVALIAIGTNNYVTSMTNAQIAALFNDIEQMVVWCIMAGILPVIVVPPPKNGQTTESRKCRWFYYRLAQYYGLPLFDLYPYLVDPVAFTYASGLSGDGTHPNDTAIATVGAKLGSYLSTLPNAICPNYLAAASELTVNTGFWQLLRNGCFADSSTNVTSWTINTTNATYTADAPTAPATGHVFDYVKTASGGAYALSGSSPSVAGGGFAVGDELFFSGHLEVSGLTPSSASGFHLALDADNNAHARPFANWKQNGVFDFGYSLIVPAGVATLTPTLFVQDAATYKVSNLTLVNVTQADAIWKPGQQGLGY